jgi:hypothetical protein
MEGWNRLGAVIGPGKLSGHLLMDVLVAASGQYDDFSESVRRHGELVPVKIVVTGIIEYVTEKFGVIEVQRSLVVLGQGGLELSDDTVAMALDHQNQQIDFGSPDLGPLDASGDVSPTLYQQEEDEVGMDFLVSDAHEIAKFGKGQFAGQRQDHRPTPLDFPNVFGDREQYRGVS